MRKSFYTWLMAQRNPKSNEPVAILADLAFEDSTFPKHTDDFEEVSRYLVAINEQDSLPKSDQTDQD